MAHRRRNKQAMKYGVLFMIPFLIALIFGMAAIGIDDVVSALLAAVFGIIAAVGLVLMIRSTRGLRQETKRYIDAYTRVATAAFGKELPT